MAAGLPERRGTARIITASTGNHGQGVAFAAARAGSAASWSCRRVLAAEDGPKIQGFGAELRISGTDIAEASKLPAAALAEGMAYVEDGENRN